ncbi:MAG: 3'-5' exonuclease [Verrucomicrobia bacterium]|nr:3'-5' exonuclease [Verrucomicrobiota bacterium]
MKTDETWAVLDIEASGMKRPLYAIEIAAQRMRGYEPDGMSFRVLLNHGVPIPLEGQALHGYTQDYLRQHGQDPRLAHELLREYLAGRPVVSHNLAMKWDRVLVPEFARLGIPPAGLRGFCALTLARRVLPETSSFSLSALNKRYKLVDGNLRGAAPDVEAVVKLFQHWFGPRLTAAGIVGFEALAEFARQTPPAKCRDRIEAAVKDQSLPRISPTIALPPSPASILKEFNELVREIMADGVMTTAEFLVLMDWLRDCPHTEVYPIDRLYEAVSRVSAVDGQVTAADQERLEHAFQYYLETGKAPPRPGEDAAPTPPPVPEN